jgi:tetratricopeptide (TPR) repeat protein
MIVGYALGIIWNNVDGFAKWLEGIFSEAINIDVRKLLVVALSGLVALLSIGSVIHSGRWANEVVLFNHAVNDSRIKIPNMYFNLGTAYMEAGDHRQAVEAFEEAIHLHPSYVSAMVNLSATLILSWGTREGSRSDLRG